MAGGGPCGEWEPCGRGPCAAEDGHKGACDEASGWADDDLDAEG